MIRKNLARAAFVAVTLTLLAGAACESSTDKASETPHLKILILGGTGFIGPWEVEAARAHGHEVTLFNRGKTRPELFDDLETLIGDRDPEKGEGLKALEGRDFDVVIDNSGYYPRHVKASAELLGPNVKQYIYVSSISAYANTDVEGQDVTVPLATMDDPTVEEMGEGWANYGPLKALCEAAKWRFPVRRAIRSRSSTRGTSPSGSSIWPNRTSPACSMPAGRIACSP